MSGIEIAGLVLGAIPLVIAALEHYEDIMEPTLAFSDFHSELMKAVVALTTQQALFRQNLENLLQPITTDAQLIDMLENTKSKEWQNPEIEKGLKLYLGKAYFAYVRTITEVQRIMVDIAKKLENVPGVEVLDKDGLEALISGNAASIKDGFLQRLQFSKRVKFTMSRKSIKRSMKDLRRCLADLASLRENASQLAVIEASHDKSPRYRYSPPIEKVRQDTIRMFEGLSKAWCSRHASHATGLLLERRRAQKRQQRCQSLDDSSEICFNLTIRMASASVKTDWKAVEIRMLDKCDQQTKPRRTNVRFALPTPPAPRPISARQSLIPHNGFQLQVIDDVCRVLKTACQSSVGLCVDADGRLRGAYDAKYCSSSSEEEIRLGDLLRSRSKVLRRDRYLLAITLVSSLLQLSSTPWMMENWDKERIFFHKNKVCSAIKGNQITTTNCADIKFPYLAFEHVTQKQISDSLVKPAAADSAKLLALGVMLIEICEKKPFETLYKPSDVEQDGTHTDSFHLLAGTKWLHTRASSGKINGAFVRAITHCLQSYSNPGASISNPDFVKSLEENVLESLEEEMYLLFEKI